MSNKKTYWKGIEQLENTPKFRERANKEFAEYLPVNEGNGDPSRRDFLKMMGFGVAAASLAACEAPVKKAIPYVNKPVDVDPTLPNYYASTYAQGSDYCSIVVKTREGRPIHIEGNSLSKISMGKVNTQVASSILSLYDQQRFKNPKIGGEDTDWNTIDNRIKAELATNKGKLIVVSYSNCSPSTQKAIRQLRATYSGVEHVQYDAISSSGLLDAYEKASGKRAFPQHNFSKAKTIVAVSCDFIGAQWPNHALTKWQFSKTRKLSGSKKKLSRLYAFESNLSLTGANADYREPIKPSEEATYLANLYNELASKASVAKISAESLGDGSLVKKAANDLWKTKGSSVVVSGSNNPDVQSLVIAINQLVGAYDSIIDLNKSINFRKGSDKEFMDFVRGVKSGSVSAVIFYNCNPIYDHKLGKTLEENLAKVKTTIATSDTRNETSELVKYITPDHHYLESWNDFEPVSGHLSLAQPTISNIFNTRQAQESFLVWSGANKTYYDFIRENWKAMAVGRFESFWDKCLHDGVYEIPRSAESEYPIAVSVDVATLKLNTKASNDDNMELVIYANNSVGDGLQANNPWLQEMPDPITKACWDNYLTVNPREAREKGWDVPGGDMDFRVGKLTVGENEIELPILPQPGQAYGTLGIPVGYGRTNAGKVADNVGVNAFPLIDTKDGFLNYNVLHVQLSITEKVTKVAQTQTSQTYSGRENVIQEATLSEYKKDPQAGRSFPEISLANGEKEKPNAVSLWKGHEYANHHWGMIVDLNSCTGCGTCTVACQVENNIPVVGKQEVLNRREMHWIRIDRYYSYNEKKVDEATGLGKVRAKEIAAADNPEVVFQPMMCQQCNSAPCETVCPVAATTHSSEGLNQMTYNRCIGTRYCANNCPYKVRRFNWFKYHDNDKFSDNLTMNNDLGKMVLNPDVTVRARGVMEKCTFCVQRIQTGKLKAKIEKRRPTDSDFDTACSSACPSDAIIFGDMKDPKSKISKTLKIKEVDKGVEAEEPRAYHVLEELRVMPNVWYLTKIRNKDENKVEA